MATEKNIPSSPVGEGASEASGVRGLDGDERGHKVQEHADLRGARTRAPLTRSLALAALSHKGRGLVLHWSLSVASVFLFVAAWHIATTYRLDLHIRFVNVPSPLAVLGRAVLAFHNPRFLEHIGVSLQRIGAGFSLAALIAIPLGLGMGRSLVLRSLVTPVVEVLRPIPAIAWVPMSIMLWPTSEESIVFITFLGSFFPILINTLHGVAAIDPALVRASRSLGAGEAALFRHVFLPGALPHIFTGLTVGMGVAWVSLIAAEMISGQFGIGYFTWEAYSLVQYADIVLGMLLIGILGLLSSGLIRLLGVFVMPWRPRHRSSNREAVR